MFKHSTGVLCLLDKSNHSKFFYQFEPSTPLASYNSDANQLGVFMNGKKAEIVGVGLGLGAAFGIILGLLLFPDNIALGVPLGMAIGFGISSVWAQQTGDDE
jgi:hypothetical protein